MICFLRQLEHTLNEGGLSIQFYSDRSYRIYDSSGEIILDSEELDFDSDFNDLGYEQEEQIASIIRMTKGEKDVENVTRNTSVQT